MDKFQEIFSGVIVSEDEKTGEKSVWVDYEDFKWLGKTILALRMDVELKNKNMEELRKSNKEYQQETEQIKIAYEDRVSDVESYVKALEEIQETYIYGQPNHEGEIMVDCDVTCDHMYQIALDATTIKE